MGPDESLGQVVPTSRGKWVAVGKEGSGAGGNGVLAEDRQYPGKYIKFHIYVNFSYRSRGEICRLLPNIVSYI